MPVATPVSAPVPTPIVAIAGRLLSHVPPGVASVRILVEPTHTLKLPAIGAGNGLTVISRVAGQLPTV